MRKLKKIRIGPTNKISDQKIEDDLEDRSLLECRSAEIDDDLDRIWKFPYRRKGVSSRSNVQSGGTATEPLYKFENVAKNE